MALKSSVDRRPSVERATDWRSHAGEEVRVARYAPPPATPLAPPPEVAERLVTTANGEPRREQPPLEDQEAEALGALEAARVGLGAVLVLGGMYAVRKLVFKR